MKLYVFLICLCALTFGSCTAYHHGSISGGSYPTSPDYKLKQMAYGQAGTFKILGLGGWNTDAIVLEAKRNLRRNYELKSGQAFVNYTVDFARTLYPFVSTTKVLVSAEVVELSDQNMAYGITDSPKTGIETGDEIFLKAGGENYESPIEKAYILEESTNTLKVLYFKEGGRPKVKNIIPDKYLLLFKSFMSVKEQETYSFNIGDTITFTTTQFLKDPRLISGTDEETKQGIVLAKNQEDLFIVDPLDSSIPEGVYAIVIPTPEQ